MRPPTRTSPFLALVAMALAAATAGCSSSRGAQRGAAPPRAPEATAADVADTRAVDVSQLSPEQVARFQEAWRLFVTRDPRWPAARDAWIAEGGAAPYMLSENLFRYWWSAAKVNRVEEVLRAGESAQKVGEPAVAYFAKALVTERWPLREPVTTQVFNPDNLGKPITKTFTHFDVDDTTRQHAARVLAMIGQPALPTLLSPAVQNATLASARTYGLYTVGAIATDEAVAYLDGIVRTAPEWRTRGAAAKALGFSLRRNEKARAPLEAALADSDRFVREKAQEALQGKSRIEF